MEVMTDANTNLNAYLDETYGKPAEDRVVAFDRMVDRLKDDILEDTESALVLQEELINTDGFFECIVDIFVARKSGMPMATQSHLSRLHSYFDQAAIDHATYVLEHR